MIDRCPLASRALLAPVAAALCACAAPFTAVRATSSAQGVTATACGASSVSGAAVLKAMDGPPLGETGSGMEGPREVTFCVRIENQGDAPVQVDRGHLHLECPRERQPWRYDSDDVRFVVPPHDARRLHVTFAYSPLLSGEDVRLDLSEAVTRKGRPVPLAPLVLRKR